MSMSEDSVEGAFRTSPSLKSLEREVGEVVADDDADDVEAW